MAGRFGEYEDEGDAGVGEEEDACEVRCRAGEDIDAYLSEGVTKLVNAGNRNRC